jgi:hypothetical protein
MAGYRGSGTDAKKAGGRGGSNAGQSRGSGRASAQATRSSPAGRRDDAPRASRGGRPGAGAVGQGPTRTDQRDGMSRKDFELAKSIGGESMRAHMLKKLLEIAKKGEYEQLEFELEKAGASKNQVKRGIKVLNACMHRMGT